MARLIRVTALAASRRRAGFAFGREPQVIGQESLAEGMDGFRQLAAIVTDPALIVEWAEVEAPDAFVLVTADDRAELIESIDAIERAAAIGGTDNLAEIIDRLIGEHQLRSPEEPEANGDGAAVSPPADEGKADGGTDDNAAPAAETPPASDGSAPSDEQSRAGADASGAAPAVDASAEKQPGDTQQPPVADGITRAATPAADAANPVAVAPAAPAATDPKKGAAVPAEVKAPAVAKPRKASGRKPAANTGAAG